MRNPLATTSILLFCLMCSACSEPNIHTRPIASSKAPTQASAPRDLDGNNILLIANKCSNPEAEISKLIDVTIVSVEKRTGRKMSRGEVIFKALAIIDAAEKDKKYPRNADGKFEFGAIAAAVGLS